MSRSWPSEPDQPPEAVQEVAFVVDQLKVELLPLAMELGLAARLTVGAGVGGGGDGDRGSLGHAAAGTRTGQTNKWHWPSARRSTENRSTALALDQAPEAVQAVALLADQARRRASCRSQLRLGSPTKRPSGAGEVTGYRSSARRCLRSLCR